MRAAFWLSLAGLSAAVFGGAAGTFSDANWMSLGGIRGANGTVNAAVVDSSGNLYIGGEFTLVGETFASRVAKWNGSSWSALGAGLNGTVSAMAVSGNDLYVGGNFTAAGETGAANIAKWNGSSWSALGLGIDGAVNALVVSGSDVYAGGRFTTADGGPATNIAKWDGSSWSPLGSGLDGDVYALAVAGSDIYAGGDFTTVGGSTVTNVAKWNGSSWTSLGSGIGGYVYALAVSGANVYAGGYFATAGDRPAINIAKWNGSSWSALSSGLNGPINSFYTPTVYALVVSGGDVYAGGYFTTAGGVFVDNLAKWNGSSWSALNFWPEARGSAAEVYALAVSGSNVYAGGAFTAEGGTYANYVAKWNGSNWSALGSGMSSSYGVSDTAVSAMVISGTNLYVGGRFETAGNSAASHIAKWDGSSWTSLGSGMDYDGSVSALAVSSSSVYAGGQFTTAGDSAANCTAKWNGSNWLALGSGMGSGDPSFAPSVFALAISGSDLYAGGQFTTAGGNTATNIAKWNGSSWSALGSGLGGDFNGTYVSALMISGNDLYAGGRFTNAGGTAANYVAKWDGSSWSALGSGVGSDDPFSTPYVYALAVSGTNLYAGGRFKTAGGYPALNIAEWNGTSWSALGSGISTFDPYLPVSVYALAVSGKDLYAGGEFTSAGGVIASFIAKWDGSNWTNLGSGMGPPYDSNPLGDPIDPPNVLALVVSGSDLYASGSFTTAGGKVSAYVARAYILPLPALSIRRSGTPQAGITISWPSLDTTGFALEQVATLAVPTSWASNTANIGDDGTNKSVTIPATNNAQFFRLRRP